MVYSSGLKSVFEKHPFREELVWAEGLTGEIAGTAFSHCCMYGLGFSRNKLFENGAFQENLRKLAQNLSVRKNISTT